MGEWKWETGMNFNQIDDFERIRDYGLMVIYSNWSFLKNEFGFESRYQILPVHLRQIQALDMFFRGCQRIDHSFG